MCELFKDRGRVGGWGSDDSISEPMEEDIKTAPHSDIFDQNTVE